MKTRLRRRVPGMTILSAAFGIAASILIGGPIPATAQTDDPLRLERTNPGYDAAKSARTLAEDFAGTWRVTVAPDGGATPENVLRGRAVVAEDGSGVTLTLKGPDGDERFESVEAEAIKFAPGTGKFDALLTVRFRKVETSSPAPDTGFAARPLAVAKSEKTVSFKLHDGASGEAKASAKTLSLPLLWRDVEREHLRVQIATRADPDRYDGTWKEERNGSYLGGGATVWVRGEPAIDGIIVLDDQSKHAYPFPQNEKKEGGKRTRRLALYGKHLPSTQTEDGKPVTIDSADGALRYVLLKPSAMDKRRLIAEAQRMRKAIPEKAQATAEKRTVSTISATPGKPAERPRYRADPEKSLADGDVLFAVAHMNKGVASGYKDLSIGGASAEWPLLFADQAALLHFARRDDEARNDGVEVFFPGDIGVVELILESDMPFETIPVEVLVRHPDAEAPEEPMVLLARRLPQDDPVYRTEPIRFVDAGDPVKQPPDEADAVSLVVKKDTRLAAYLLDPTQANARPDFATATVESDPGELGPLWEDALKRVAACEGEVWQGDPKFALQTTEKISKVTVGDFLIKVARYHSPLAQAASELQGYDAGGKTRFEASANLVVGDHAAALLIRDELVPALQKIQPALRRLAVGETDVRAFRMAARLSKDLQSNTFWQDSVAEYVRPPAEWSIKSLLSGDLIKSTKEQRTVKVRLVETLDEAAMAKKFGIDPSEARKWAEEATQQAAADLYAKTDLAIARASGNSCDLAELLVVAGQKPDPFVARLLPRLVKRKSVAGPPRTVNGKKVPGPPIRQYWVADNLARGFVQRLGAGAEGVRALKEYAALDDNYKAMAVALVTAGAGAGLTAAGYGGAGLSVALLGDAADAAYFGLEGVRRYQEAEDYYAFAQGTAPVLGRDVLAAAEAKRESGVMAAVGVLLPSVGALSNAGQLRHLRQLDHANTIKQGQKIFATKGAKALDEFESLPAAEKTAMMAYYKDLIGKARASGPASLSDADRTALEGFQDLVRNKGGTPPSLDPPAAPIKTASADPDATVRLPGPVEGSPPTVTMPGPVDGVSPTVTGVDPHATLPPPGRTAGVDPEATVTVPGPGGDLPPTVTDADPFKTATLPGRTAGVDPEATVTIPGPVEGVPPTVTGASPDATLPPGRTAGVDPEATVTVPGPGDKVPPTTTGVDPEATLPPGRTAGIDPEATVTVPGPGDTVSPTATGVGPDATLPPGRTAGVDPEATVTVPGPVEGVPPTVTGVGPDATLPPGRTAGVDPGAATSAPIPPRQPVRVTQDANGDLVVKRLKDGQELRIPTGDVRDGSFSQTYPVPGRPDLVAKFTSKEAGPAGKLDKMGYDVAKTLDPTVVEVPKVEWEYDVASSPVIKGTKKSKDFTGGTLRIVKRAPDDFKNANPAIKMANGSMTPGQAIAFDKGMRALNRKGYAWLDNKYDNYAFRRVGKGDDWKLVIVDTGGIVPMRGLDPDAARALQRAVDNPSANIRRHYRTGGRFGVGVHQEALAQRFDGLVDWNRINQTTGARYRSLYNNTPGGAAGQFPYNPINGYRYPKTGTLATAETQDAATAAYEALRAAHPLQ